MATTPREARLPFDGDRLFVTLRQPIGVMLTNRLTPIAAFEATYMTSSTTFGVFRTFRMWCPKGGVDDGREVTMRIDVTVPFENIAGMVPAPEPVK